MFQNVRIADSDQSACHRLRNRLSVAAANHQYRSVPIRNEDFPENLLIKWRSHAGFGFNMSTMCLLLHLQLKLQMKLAGFKSEALGPVLCAHRVRPVCEGSKWYCETHLLLNREASKRCRDKKRAAGGSPRKKAAGRAIPVMV